MKLKYIPLIILSIAIYALASYFIGKFVYKGIANYIPITKTVFTVSFVILSLSYSVSMLIGRYLPGFINKFLLLIGSYWMAFLMYALIIFPVVVLFNIILSKFSFYSNFAVKISLIETIVITIFFLFVGVLGYLNGSRSYVNSYIIPMKDIGFEKPLNIVMVSDIHLGNLIGNKRIEKMVSEINELNVDVILIAGDIIDSDITPFLDKDMAKGFSKLKSKYGTYATLGNHDLMTNATSEIVSSLENNNVRVLRNEAVLLDNSFYIVGRDDISAKRFGIERDSLDNIVENLDDKKPKLVIDHTPNAIDESLNAGFDIQFSGHTHAGQLNPCNLVTKKIFEIDHGYLKKEKLHVIVSCGYGTWGPPIRIGSKSEIVNVIIK
ncbi:MAG: metallophosphoesterase [Clostridium sp.]